MSCKPHILFVCSRNQWRSPTAERIYANDQRVDVRSAGLNSRSKHRISHKDLLWADMVLVMENRHKTRILEAFRDLETLPFIDSLDIPDEYEYMDRELIEAIREGTEHQLMRRFGVEPGATRDGP